MDPLSTNLTYIFSALLKDALTEYSYAAELAGLAYDIHNTLYGLMLSIRGYNDKQHVLLQKLMDKITSFEICEKRFAILLEKYIRGLKNFRAEQPHQHAVYYMNLLAMEQAWTKEELLDATEQTTIDRLRMFVPRLLSQIFVEMLIYGNVTKQIASNLSQIVENTLVERINTRPLLPSQRRRFREIQLFDGCSYVYQQQNDIHKSSSLEVYYQCSVEETRSNVLLELFCQVIAEPCFDILRTQEQLGYIVFSGVRRSNGVQGLRVIVQSDRTPQYVEARVEAFLHKMKSMLEEMKDEEFNKHVSALAVKRLELPKKLSTQNSKYWGEIVNEQYHFDRDEVEVNCLRKLTKDDLLKFYQELIAHDSPRRHKLSVHVVSAVSNDLTDSSSSDDGNDFQSLVQQATPICCMTSFKRDLALFPLPRPYIRLDSPYNDMPSKNINSKL
jgi:insulysin